MGWARSTQNCDREQTIHAEKQTNKYQSSIVWTLMTPRLLALGKWCRVERYDVPEEYFQYMLADMPHAFINSIREKRHLRPPVWRETSKVLSYRDYHISDVVDALEKQSGLKLHIKKAYLGDKEITACTEEQDGRTELEAAKAQAHIRTASKSPTLQIQIVIGRGEGRATREFELIWWPEMFSSSRHGKLALRFFVSKVNFS